MTKRLEIIVFLSGAVGMILELVGSRVLSPFFGNSLFVWTGLIGVVLGSMSLGYHFGGRMADKDGSMNRLSQILLLAGVFVLFTAFFKEPVLTVISRGMAGDVRSGSLLSIIVLFGPASLLLGCVSPYAAKIRLSGSEKIGRTIGSLYALSTMGSIVGTFSAGYLLIPSMGNSSLLYLLSALLLILSVISSQVFSRVHQNIFLILIVLYYLNTSLGIMKLTVIEDVDSLYNRILVRNIEYRGKEATSLTIENHGAQSLVYASSPGELVSDYTNAYRIGGLIKPDINEALMLGGAGFSFPRYFLENNLGKHIDVVEIDGKMIDMAKKHFYLKDDDRMSVFVQDARMFMKNNGKKYDVIYFDAFGSINPPYHLTTLEFLEDLASGLTDDGVIMFNVVGSTRGPNSSFLSAEIYTMSKVFNKVDMFVIQEKSSTEVQNLMVVAYKGERPEEVKSDDPLLSKLIKERYFVEDKVSSEIVLTDDYAPVDFMVRSLYSSVN